MPASAIRVFDDIDDYTTSIRAGQYEAVIAGRGSFEARLVRIDLQRLWMQRFTENLPHIARAATSPSRAIVMFTTSPTAPISWGGRDVTADVVVRVGIGQEAFHCTRGPAQWASLSLPVDDYFATAAALTHHDVQWKSDGLAVRPSAEALARLRSLHAVAGALAEHAPAVLANPETARCLEQEIIAAMIASSTEAAEEDKVSVRQHQAILRRFRTLIAANADNPLYLPEICTALGVSVRTLQRCCHEQLGVSPLRYLWLRRMNMARRALTASSPGQDTVTAIASRYGFWELGRFATAYRSLFGEAPSTTLHRVL